MTILHGVSTLALHAKVYPEELEGLDTNVWKLPLSLWERVIPCQNREALHAFQKALVVSLKAVSGEPVEPRLFDEKRPSTSSGLTEP